MREFERITVDAKVANGLACIRDTEITVSEVVKAIQGGKSVSEMIEAYDGLTVDDVVEAQRYAIQDLLEVIAIYRNDGLSPLATIMGYCELLLGKIGSDYLVLSDEKRQKYTEAIFNCAHRGKVMWWNLREIAGLCYEHKYDHQDRIAVSQLISEIQQNITAYEPTGTLVATVSGNSALEVDSSIAGAIVHIATYLDKFLLPDATLTIDCNINNLIHFELVRRSRYPGGDMGFLKNVSGFHGMPIDIARIIILNHGGELSIRMDGDNAIFSFDLSISDGKQ